MPHMKSAKKRLRQDEKLQMRNRGIRSRMQTAIRRANEASPEDREAAVRRAVSAIDRAVKAGVIKKATASRKKSTLMKQPSSESDA
ncbi:MAG: 30S ribosomal protein S20 [Candidatus Eisenbacteria bacterium]|nr:30S ribosomal protein S20 [Candidatus Eisenbacteria bacterium]